MEVLIDGKPPAGDDRPSDCRRKAVNRLALDLFKIDYRLSQSKWDLTCDPEACFKAARDFYDQQDAEDRKL